MKKTIKLSLYAFMVLGMYSGLNAQTNTFPASGNVGIGTTNPVGGLHVAGKGISIANNCHPDFNGQGVETAIDYCSAAGGLRVQSDTNILLNPYGGEGNVGIGTDSPVGGLHVAGKGISIANNCHPNFGGEGVNSAIDYCSGAGGFRIHSDTNILLLPKEGNVGIGTSNPGNWKLAVNGNVRAKKVVVESGWSDFVFDPGYELPTLSEVETHIAAKGHLQDIPSATEVAEHGISLGEMDAKLLQKIEELMLYTIEQQKQIEALKAQLGKQNRMNNE